MATFPERSDAIIDALVNGDASATLKNRLGLAVARWRASGEEYEAANATDKARIGVECMRDILIGIVKHTEGTDAVEAVNVAVDADFAPQAAKP